MIMRHGVKLLALCGLLLAGCSAGNNAASPGRFLQNLATSQVSARLGGKESGAPQASAITRADIAGITDPLMRLSLPKRDLGALMFLKQTRAPYQLWFTIDNVGVTTRSGMVSTARGLGYELFGVIDPVMINLLEGKGGPGAGKRVHRVMNGANEVIDIPFDCTVQDLGAETKVVLQMAHATRHLQQSCTGVGESFVNDYWQGGGIVWASRQWMGPDVGYADLERLIQ